MSDPNPARMVRQLRSAFGPDTGENDGALLARFADHGDESAFERIVLRHTDFVQRLCFSALRDHHAAEDACQATFLVLARKAGPLRGSDSVTGWLYRVGRRIAVKYAARRAKRGSHELLEDVPAGAPPVGADADTISLVHDEIARLPERYRVPVIVCMLEGLTHAEAATQLGWPIGTVAGRLARAKAILERRLARRGACAGAALIAALAPSNVPAVQPAYVAATLAGARAFAAGKSTCSSVPLEVLNLSNGELKTMFTARLLVALGAVVAVGLAGAMALAQNRTPDAPPPAVPAIKAADKLGDLIVGRWQGEGQKTTVFKKNKDPEGAKEYVEKMTIEFNKDGSIKIVGTGIPELKIKGRTQTGTYRFVSVTEIELKLKVDDGKEEKTMHKFVVTKDELTLTEAVEDHPRTGTFKRVK